METVKILRELWRRRLIVSVLAALSIALGIVLTHRVGLPPESRHYQVGVAGARLLIDTPKSQFVAVAPLGAETLGQRANLLAALMAAGDVKATIARRAGLAPGDLLAVSESSAEPQTTVSSSDLSAPDIHLLTTRVVRDSEGAQLPIIEVETQAPDTAAATRLVNATVTGVAEYLDSKAAGEQIADRRRLQVSSLGINPGRVEVRGPHLLIGFAAGLFAFLGGCGLVLLVSALSRGWREAEAEEEDRGHGGSGPTSQDPSGGDAIDRELPSAPSPPRPRPRPRSVDPAPWHHPERVDQPSAEPRAAPDEAAMMSGALPGHHRDDQPGAPATQERRPRRSRVTGLQAVRSVVPETVVAAVAPGASAEDKRSLGADPRH